MSTPYILSSKWRVDIARLDGLISSFHRLEAQLEVLVLYQEEFTQARAIRANPELDLLLEKTEQRIADKRLALEQIRAACEKIERERELHTKDVARGGQAIIQPNNEAVGRDQLELVKELQLVKARLHEAAARMTPNEFRAYLYELQLDEGAAADWLASDGTLASITNRMRPHLTPPVDKGPSA